MNQESVKGLILADLWELAYRAHYNTSFSPDKRATSYITDFSEELEADLKLLGDAPGNYKEKYISYFRDWLSAKGRCLSSMITGQANFPVGKAQKANRAEESKYNQFREWREKYFKAVNRVPVKGPEEELMIAERNLEFLKNLQEEYKAINAHIRKAKITPETLAEDEFVQFLKNLMNEHEYSLDAIKEASNHYGKYTIPSFVLTNNNASIKRTEEKVKIMQVRIERKTTWKDIRFEGGYVTIEDDRVKIIHEYRPEQAVIDEIKKNGFRWSPFWKAWVRKHTGNSVAVAKNLSFVKSAIEKV